MAPREGPVPLVAPSPTSRCSTPPPDFDRLARRAGAGRPDRAPAPPARAAGARSACTPPVWVDDPDFDLDYHVRQRRARPRPATMRQLLDLAVAARRRPVRPHPAPVGVPRRRRARGRPGRVLIRSFHHTLIDGEGGAAAVAAVHRPRARRPRAEPLPPEAEPASLAPPATPRPETARDVVTEQPARPIGPRSRSAPSCWPTRSASPTAGAARRDADQSDRDSSSSDTKQAHSPLWTERSLRRRLETLPRPARRRQGWQRRRWAAR